MTTGEFCGWSIYPEQLPAMIDAMRKRLTEMRATVVTGKTGDSHIAREMLKAIGLAEPQTSVRTPKSTKHESLSGSRRRR